MSDYNVWWFKEKDAEVKRKYPNLAQTPDKIKVGMFKSSFFENKGFEDKKKTVKDVLSAEKGRLRPSPDYVFPEKGRVVVRRERSNQKNLQVFDSEIKFPEKSVELSKEKVVQSDVS